MGRQFNRRSVVAGGALGAAWTSANAQTSAPQARHHGVVVRVPDLDAALAFYGDGMGFAVADIRGGDGWARLASNVPIYLEVAAGGRLHPPGTSHVEITFQSNELEQSIPVLRSAGAQILTEAPHEVAVGHSIRFADPVGIVHHMLQSNRAPPVFAEPRVYNCGFEVPESSIAGSRSVLEQGLGFIPMTERYFPPSVPYLEQDRSFAFMLHHHQPFEPDHTSRQDAARDDLGVAQVFVTRDLPGAARSVRQYGAVVLDRAPRRFPYGRRLAAALPGGAPFELWAWQ